MLPRPLPRNFSLSNAVLLCLLSLMILIGLAWALPLPDRLGLAGSAVLLYRDDTAAHVFLAADERWRIPADLGEIDPRYLRALQALEDERFPLHPGVDPISVARAAGTNLSRGRVVSGASTLTMQLVRMLEPRPRQMSSKAIEAARALQLEIRLGKREVLEGYLSYLPYGRNIEGLEAASLWYFGHSARRLSPTEIATLLAVPQAPGSRFPSPARAPRLREARDEILKRLYRRGLFQGEIPLEEALAEAVPTQIRPIPREAPHAALWMRAQLPGVSRLRSTLDAGLQRVVERRLDQIRAARAAEGVHNVAVVVVDHQTSEIRALAGNFDFWDEAHGGQIISFDAPRSPGSALKPFVYARAIDEGLALPGFLVPDAPVSFGAYTPENYDGVWSGLSTLEESLSRSLNVPFIHLLQRVGTEPFLGFLRRGGAAHLDPTPGHYGLSLVAGSIELTPLEIATMYAALAGDGAWHPLIWQRGEMHGEGQPWISPGAAWLTRRALRLRERPDFPTRASVALPAGIHWKTGTSFGNRDAWAAGSGERYTVVVWLGNLDNRPSTHLVGAEVAAPLLFDLLDSLGDRLQSADPPPEELRPVEVCALSGHPAGESCPERRTALARQQRVPTDRCPYHRRVELNPQGLRVNASCRGEGWHAEGRVVWPPAVRRWLGTRFLAEAEAPPWAEGCMVPDGEPVIRSPQANMTVLLMPGVPADQQEIPLENNGGEPPFAWYVDGRFLGSGEGERLWWQPAPGRHEIVVMDGGGGSDRVLIEVREGG